MSSAGDDRTFNRLLLPIELWGEILRWLPRSSLKTLLHIPHPLRGSASELYFQEIDLHFENHPQLDMALNVDLAQSAAWNMQRSLEILTRILRNVLFACRVRMLKISENESANHDSSFEIGELLLVYPCLALYSPNTQQL
jgi:hypothetical protein